MEKAGYRENLEMLMQAFPGRAAITVKEAAQITSTSIYTIYDGIRRERNPIPAKEVNKKKIIIPIAGLARWLS